jgi:hypothetical protein
MKKSYLKLLVGQKIIEVTGSLSEVVSLKSNNNNTITESIMSVYVQIIFEEYQLSVFNRAEIINHPELKVQSLIGLKVVRAIETKTFAELFFENSISYRVDLRDEGNNDPEAMALYGPNNLIVVWN